MDRAAIEELWTFTDYSWGEYERAIRPHGDAILIAPAPGSGWPALGDALGHINWGYVRWLADRPGRAMSQWNGLSRGTNSTTTAGASSVMPAGTSIRSGTMS